MLAAWWRAPIRNLLVANRSEIAIRIFRAAAELRLETVAIDLSEDRFSLHRLKADESYLMGRGKSAVEAYLGIKEIVRVAADAGVDAIRPGYGFLSENPDLAAACAAEGIVWVGPPIEVMEGLATRCRPAD